MRVIIRESAYDDLDRIHAWIAKDRPRSADSVIDRILESTERLGRFSYIGRVEIVVCRLADDDARADALSRTSSSVRNLQGSDQQAVAYLCYLLVREVIGARILFFHLGQHKAQHPAAAQAASQLNAFT